MVLASGGGLRGRDLGSGEGNRRGGGRGAPCPHCQIVLAELEKVLPDKEVSSKFT